jgi:DNA-binding transcriptional regulator YiaG
MQNRTLSHNSNYRHGHALAGKETATYICWRNMISRCENKNQKDYKYYGGRGIQVCERWRTDFTSFLRDMGEKPKGMSIDRIDNNGDYEPSNCRWETHTNQMNNKRNSVLITREGLTLNASEWARRIGVDHHTIARWHRKGTWPQGK